MEFETPLVSVIITTYNRHDFLRSAIESVEQQTYDNIELIVIDGCSDESPAHIIDAVDHDRFTDVIFKRHDTNRGVSAARNTGIESATGEYIALLDDDDQWQETKIEQQIKTVQQASDDIGVVYTGIRSVEDDGSTTISKRTPTHGRNATKAVMFGLGIPLSSIMVRRSVLDAAGGFTETMTAHEDREWIIRLSTECEFAVVPEPLVISARGSGAESHDQLTDDTHAVAGDDFEQYIDRCRPIAKRYGRLAEQKMVGHSFFRVGYALISHDENALARRFLGRALLSWPFVLRFYIFFILSLASSRSYGRLRQYKRSLADYRHG